MAITQHITTTTNWGPNLIATEYLEKVFLDAVQANTTITPLGVRSTMPENNSTKVRWIEWTAPTAGTTAVTEGTDPADSIDIVNTKYEATLAEFTGYEEVSRQAWKTTMSGSLEEMASLMGYRAAISMDALTFQEVDGSTTVVDSLTAMTADSVRKARGTLRKSKVMKHPATPGGRFYCGLFSPEAASDMEGEGSPAWWQVKSRDYAESLTVPFEDTPATAAIHGVIIKEADNVQAVSSEDLNLIFGDQAFGVAALDTDVLRPYVVVQPPESNIAAKARNWGYLSYFFLFKAKIFGNAKTVVVKSDVT
jgi:N4-gp56 family major capsid protein